MKKFYYDEILENGRFNNWTMNENKAKELGYTESIDEDKVLPAIDGFYYLSEYAILKNNEILAKKIRRKRNECLKDSDKYMLPDYPLSDEQRELAKQYRQALREIPEQPNFPMSVQFPEVIEFWWDTPQKPRRCGTYSLMCLTSFRFYNAFKCMY